MNKALYAVEKYSMLPKGCTVIVGVSGGADSMALLHFLLWYATDHGISVIAAHVNHGLRGQEAQRDEDFVRSWCKEHSVACEVLRADVAALAKERGCGLEECGRQVRYSYFASLAHPRDALIATAHTASDNAETLLLHLVQGAGTRGLCGIPPVRGRIIRPLLFASRAQVEAYCEQNNIPFVTDSSNGSAAYTRNRLRQRVIPLLKEENPKLEDAVARTASLLREDEDALTLWANQALREAGQSEGYAALKLAHLPAAVRKRALRRAAEEAGAGRLETVHLEELDRLLFKRGEVSLPGGLRMRSSQGFLRVLRETTALPADWEFPVIPGSYPLPDGRNLQIEQITRKEYEQRLKFNKLLFNQSIDYATITDSIQLRSRRAGDTFRPAGRGVTKTLKKLLNEAAVPSEQRGSLLVLAAGDKVLWLESFGAAEGARVTEKTERVLLMIPEEL